MEFRVLEGVPPDDVRRFLAMALAELAGTARGTVNRVLREEQEQGAVLLERGRVRVLEPASLADRVRGLPG